MDSKFELYLTRIIIRETINSTFKEIMSKSNGMPNGRIINVNINYNLKGNHTILFDKTYCNSYSERRIINELKRFLYSLQRRR